MGYGVDQVLFRGVDVSVPSVVIMWAPSRGVNDSIGSYSLKVVGCICGGGREGTVVGRDTVGFVCRVCVERGGVDQRLVVVVGVLLLCGCEALGGTGGDVAVERDRGLRGRGNYRQAKARASVGASARVPAKKILLFSIASVHGGLYITPAPAGKRDCWALRALPGYGLALGAGDWGVWTGSGLERSKLWKPKNVG